jgi:hypothetical protein
MSAGGMLTPPPPSPELMAKLAGLRPVRTRRPWRALGWAALASLMYAGLLLAVFPVRGDFAGLPHLWWAAVGVAWLAGFVAPLALAIVPRPRAVLPDGRRAGWAALAATAVLVTVGLMLTPHAPNRTIIPVGAPAIMHSIRHCLALGMVFAVVPMVAGMVALRHLLLVGGARLMAAVGAAAGAFGGMVLHVICSMGGSMHTGLGHAGPVVVATALGAVLGVALGRRRT